ncbi:MAG: fasciclin domain-containing protein [Psychroserpens sp.]|uniref:fasciclin domain-containing protein n=1 Tax=Psychroserpens sp. TaxID=2020870 RepID=UPI003C73B06F
MKKIIQVVLVTFLIVQSCKNESKYPNELSDSDQTQAEMKEQALTTTLRPIYEVLEQDPEYNNFLKLVNIADYFDQIKALDNVMVFAPTAAGIDKLTDTEYADLKLPQNMQRLRNVLSYHIVEGEINSASIISTIKASGEPMRLKTIQGANISLNIDDNQLTITDEFTNTYIISDPDQKGSNGVVHGIDGVLVPQPDDKIIK